MKEAELGPQSSRMEHPRRIPWLFVSVEVQTHPGGRRWRSRGRDSPQRTPGARFGRREPRLGGRRIRPRERRIRWGGGAGGLWRRGPGQEAAARRACEGCGPAVALTARCRVGWARICWGRRWVGVVGGRRPCEEAPPPPSLSPGGLPRGGLSGGGEEVGREGEGAVGGGGPPGSPRGDASGALFYSCQPKQM